MTRFTICCNLTRRIEIGHESLDLAVADVEAAARLWVGLDLLQNHLHGLPVVVLVPDDGEHPLREGRVLGLLGQLDECSALVLDGLDEGPALADDHARRRVGNDGLHLLLALGGDLD